MDLGAIPDHIRQKSKPPGSDYPYQIRLHGDQKCGVKGLRLFSRLFIKYHGPAGF
jgi:hypothetical protein